MLGRICLLAGICFAFSQQVQAQVDWQSPLRGHEGAVETGIPRVGMYTPSTSSMPWHEELPPGENPFRVEMPQPRRAPTVPQNPVVRGRNPSSGLKATARYTPKLEGRTWSPPLVTPERMRAYSRPTPFQQDARAPGASHRAASAPRFSPSFAPQPLPQPLQPAKPYRPEQTKQFDGRSLPAPSQPYRLQR